MQKRDAAAILGVRLEGLTREELDAKYRELARELHPDMPTGNTEQFAEANEAHKTIIQWLERHRGSPGAPNPCPNCKGTGSIVAAGGIFSGGGLRMRCPECKGRKEVENG